MASVTYRWQLPTAFREQPTCPRLGGQEMAQHLGPTRFPREPEQAQPRLPAHPSLEQFTSTWLLNSFPGSPNCHLHLVFLSTPQELSKLLPFSS